MRIKGIGNYTGPVEKSYRILPVNIESVRLDPFMVNYTGTLQTTKAIVTAIVNEAKIILKEGRDFEVVYLNDMTKKGSHLLEINGKGNFIGTLNTAFVIKSDKTTSVEIFPENKDKNGIIWLEETSCTLSKWHGLYDRDGIFEDESRFWVTWVTSEGPGNL